MSRPTAALASNVCGSVFGLLKMAVTWTYFPPTCWMTFAYSFSAPTANTRPPGSPSPNAKDAEQPLTSSARPAAAAARARRR